MKYSTRKSGFALISTLSIMLLIVLLLVALLTLASTTTRTQADGQAKAEAQANAKLALMLALGELQKEMGPDQRISANGEILGDPESTSVSVTHPHWTGVWDSWVTDPTTAPVKTGYPSAASHHQTIGNQSDDSMRPAYGQKDKHFRKWLLSLNPSDAAVIGSAQSLALDGKVIPATGDKAIRLVGEGTLGLGSDVNDHVTAGLISVADPTDSSKITGRFGWWAGDESQKARIMADSYRNSKPSSLAEQLNRQQAPASLGYSEIPGLENVTDQNSLALLPSRNSLALVEGATEKVVEQFHNVTTTSLGVLADVREGGLKRDLSTILSQPIDPEDVYNVVDYFAYQRLGSLKPDGKDYMLYSFDDMVQSASPTGEASVPIQDLAAYYQLYDRYRRDWQQQGIQYSSRESSPANNLLTSGIMVSTPNAGLTNQENDKYLRGYSALYRQVVPVKLEYILHYAARPILPKPTDPNADQYELRIGFSPAVTLWNPNNVPVVMNFGNPEDNALMIREHPLQLDVTLEKSKGYSGTPTETKTMDFNRITNSQQGELYTVFISGNNPVVLEPGETRVFSLQVSSNTNPDGGMYEFDMALRGRVGNRYAEPFLPQLELLPGWNPEKFLIPTTDAGGSRQQAYFFTFKADDYISARITPGHGKSFSTDFAPKGRHGRNKAGVQWVFRNWRIGGRIVEGNQYQRSQFHRHAINLGLPQTASIADAADKSVILPARRAQVLIDGMQDPNDPSDDLPQPFFYYSMMAGVETHESAQQTHNAGGGRRFPSRPFTHSSALNPPMIDKLTGHDLYTHGWNWFFMGLDNYLDAPISISRDSNGYYGGGYTAENGTTHVVQQQLPLVPPLSIATLGHAHLGGFSLAVEPPWVYDRFPPSDIRVEGYRRTTASGFDGLAPRTVQAIGNSYAHPNIDKAKAFKPWGRLSTSGWDRHTNHPEPYVDHSYLANKALWDEYYFSSITPEPSEILIFGNAGLTVEEVAGRFFFEQQPLSNPRLIPLNSDLDEPKLSDMLATRDAFKDGFADKIATHQMVEGPFNVNSTSVSAWKALFTSLKGQDVAYLDAGSALVAGTDLDIANTGGVPIAGGSLPNGKAYQGSPSDPSERDQWTAFRELTATEIEELAEAMVKQVKKRGPFLSLSEFVNRRLDPDDAQLSLMGALQAAIDDPECSINEGFRDGSRRFSNDEKTFQSNFDPEGFASFTNSGFPEALEGAVAYGSSAYVDQADLLRNLPAQLTPRGDTFVIRAYGDKLDTQGNVVARAWCEAVVQRVPEYVAPASDEAYQKQSELGSEANKTFGRQFKIINFRWLSAAEI